MVGGIANVIRLGSQAQLWQVIGRTTMKEAELREMDPVDRDRRQRTSRKIRFPDPSYRSFN